MAYSSDDILTDSKLRAFYPTSNGVLSDTDILRLATDELLGILTAQEMAAVQGHLAVETTVPLVSAQPRYDIPYRAAGGKLRYMVLLDSLNNRSNVHFGRPERYAYYNQTDPGDPTAAWFEDGRVVCYPTPNDATKSLLMGIYLRPGRLVVQASATTASAAAAGASSFTCASVPAYLNGTTTIDIIRAKPPFQVIAYDLAVTTLATGGTTVTITTPANLKYAIQAGDWITKTEESVAPQLPAECHPLLAARTAKRILQARGDLTNLDAVKQDIAELESQIFEYMSNRNEGQVDTMGANSLLTTGRSRFGFGLGGY